MLLYISSALSTHRPPTPRTSATKGTESCGAFLHSQPALDQDRAQLVSDQRSVQQNRKFLRSVSRWLLLSISFRKTETDDQFLREYQSSRIGQTEFQPLQTPVSQVSFGTQPQTGLRHISKTARKNRQSKDLHKLGATKLVTRDRLKSVSWCDIQIKGECNGLRKNCRSLR